MGLYRLRYAIWNALLQNDSSAILLFAKLIIAIICKMQIIAEFDCRNANLYDRLAKIYSCHIKVVLMLKFLLIKVLW